jgi:IS4 transposase
LRAAIHEAKIDQQDILLFDRGIQKVDTYVQLDQEDKSFVTRIKVNRRYRLLTAQDVERGAEDELTILSDEWVHLFNRKCQEINHPLRLIKAHQKTGEDLWFLTNRKDLSAQEITLAYKHRWSIEVFFKFLKQRLQFKTFVSYDTQWYADLSLLSSYRCHLVYDL